MSQSILTIKQLTIAFQHGKRLIPAVSDLNLAIKPGECMGLVGESGSGKSMTALAIMQLLPHAAQVSQNSQIILDGHDLLSYSERRMRRVRGKRIGMIFQDAMSALNPVLTIGHQIDEVIDTHLAINRKARKKKALSLLEEVGINDPLRTYRSYPHELSGGMRQRAMIAMALCADPALLIADEPTTALDVTIQTQVLNLLKTLKQHHNMTLLFISHDLAVVSQLADDITVLQNGIKVEEATKHLFFSQPQHAYSKKLIQAIIPNVAKHQQVKPANELLRVSGLKVYFPIRSSLLKRTIGYIKAVDDISFTLAKGQTLALVGESGSGKTTTGKAILKLIQATQGKIFFNNQDLLSLSNKQIFKIRNEIQIIFQDPAAALNPRMMVVDSISEGLFAQKKVKNRKAALKKVDELLEFVGLTANMKWRYPHEFSGGQRQRICIARALALNPKLLVLDEPTSALDVSIQKQILELLEKLQQEYQISFLFITHNISVVAFMAHHLAVMQQGKIVEQGTTVDVLTNPQHPYTKKLLASVPKIKNQEKERIEY